MAGIRWSQPAIDDLDDIARYIARDSPKNANSLIKGIFEMVDHLETSPKLGRRVKESDDPNLREIIYRKYRIIYQIHENQLEIVRVIHGSRDFYIR